MKKKLYLCNGNGTIKQSGSAFGSPSNTHMIAHIAFRSSIPVLNSRKKLGDMVVSNYNWDFDEIEEMFTESCDLTFEYDWDTPSLLSTLADDMRYWQDFRMVGNLSELQTLIDSTIRDYSADLRKCIEWDDFDDYFTLLIVASEELKRGLVSECELHHFNRNDIDEMRW
jgi:hypothetical protein